MADENNVVDLFKRLSAMPLTGAAVEESINQLDALNKTYVERMQAGDQAVTEFFQEIIGDVSKLRRHVVDEAFRAAEEYMDYADMLRAVMQIINFEAKVVQRIAAETGDWA